MSTGAVRRKGVRKVSRAVHLSGMARYVSSSPHKAVKLTGARLNEPELASRMREIELRIARDQEFARKLLMKAGIVAEDGTLTFTFSG